ncbi:MAG TPA: amidase family protein [Planococcus sp. (in: firmicutes)]|nr:amidase family protein [Planococcus sp. (in: firmicutes)]
MNDSKVQLEEATIQAIQQAFQKKQLTSVELVQYYLDRIERYDRQGPNINSVLTLNPDALEIAADRDAKRGQEDQGLLYGIPVLLKDNIDTGCNMPTTAGAIALQHNFAKEDAFVAAQLKKAGAILLGKTNLSEWAYFMTEQIPSGYSGLGGLVQNPYGVDTFEPGSAGGSSSGTGAGLAANFAMVGIGTETSGSILSPASANSIVGIKPTVGLISRTGIIPISSSQDTAGPMARTVEDAAITLGLLTELDNRDPAMRSPGRKALTDYTPHLKLDGLKNTRIGVDETFLNDGAWDERAVMDKVMEELQAQGAIVEKVTIPVQPFHSDVLWYEFKRGVNQYLSKVSGELPVKSLADVIEFNKQDPEIRMKFDQLELEKALAMSDNPEDPRYLAHREMDFRTTATEGLDAVMAEHRLDALLFQDNRGAAMPAKAGYPSITVPAGYTSVGMPIGATFSALAYSEPKLIELAYAYEQASKKRRAPRFD